MIYKVVSVSTEYVPFLASAGHIEHYWNKPHTCYLDKWEGRPRKQWFDNDSNFKAGLASIDIYENQLDLGFTNGRHRTRWLINQGFEYIPICVPYDEIELWHQYGLIKDTKPITIYMTLDESSYNIVAFNFTK